MAGLPQPKDKPIRSKKTLDDAKECPKCMHCGLDNWDHQQLVGCHPPVKLGRGGGMGQKGHDITANLCGRPGGCHDRLDNRTSEVLTPKEQDEMWLNAMFFTMVWRIQTGRLG
jgi:hypothetical protein